ncbi:MAG: hypothetical protein JKY50_07400 [Oleispira sp.]|nr:hypothetical protein [Oleispira sp.]MBL4881173.1 hypothetical protein [Oleispira sp.]
MKTALFCWELGAGLGHLTPIKQLSKELIRRGYKVWLAARDLHNIHHIFHDIDINLIAAPVNRNNINKASQNTLSYADLIYHIGYKDKESLSNHIKGWQGIFELVNPDLIFFDHSPTAIIASQNYKAKKILMGSPFSRPPETENQESTGVFSFFDHAKTDKMPQAQSIEKETLNNINYACEKNNLTQLHLISNIFSPINFEIFNCLEEFDHFGPRNDQTNRYYLPTTSSASEKKPEWPNTSGTKTEKKIFAYLKARPNIITVINGLIASKTSAILYIAGRFELKQQLPAHIQIIHQPVCMQSILKECDLLISNANLNTMQQTALAGKPQLALPIQLEQEILLHRLQEQGVVERFDTRSPQQSQIQIQRLLEVDITGRTSLQERYEKHDNDIEIRNIFNEVLSSL